MFSKSEQLYDAIYDWKDYGKESARPAEIVAAHKTSPGNDLPIQHEQARALVSITAMTEVTEHPERAACGTSAALPGR